VGGKRVVKPVSCGLGGFFNAMPINVTIYPAYPILNVHDDSGFTLHLTYPNSLENISKGLFI
jgi:hypothetical protein